MRHGKHNGIEAATGKPGKAGDAIFTGHLGGVGPGIVNNNIHTVILQAFVHVHHAGVADVGAVLLEGDAQHQHAGAGHVDAFLDHALDDLGGYIVAHGVVQAAHSEDDFRVVAHILGFLRQIVGVNTYAVATHQPRFERQKVPFGAGSLQHGVGVNLQDVEDLCEFVDEGDVGIALGVLDDLGGLGHLDAGGQVGAGDDDGLVEIVDGFTGRRSGAGGDFLDLLHGVFLVARVDAFRAVAGKEVHVEFQAGYLLQHRHAIFLGSPRINRGFVDDDVTLFEHLAHAFAGHSQWSEIRTVVLVYRCGDCDDVDVGVFDIVQTGGAIKPVLASGNGVFPEQHAVEEIGGDFEGVVLPGVEFGNTFAVDVETHHRVLGGEETCQRQAHVTEADNCDFVVGGSCSHRLVWSGCFCLF